MIPSEEEVKIALDYEFALVEPGENKSRSVISSEYFRKANRRQFTSPYQAGREAREKPR
jgi:hypothetical protein